MTPVETSNATKKPTSPARGEAWKRTRREELLSAADRVIRRSGAQASMDEVASEAGVSRVVLYRYFGDRGGLHEALGSRYVGLVLDLLRRALEGETDPQLRLRRTTETYVRFIEDNKEIYDFLMQRSVPEAPATQATVARFMSDVAREIADVLTADITALGLDPAPAGIWANGVVGMVHLSTDWWLQSRDVSRERFLDYLVGLLSHGFLGLAADPALAAGIGLRPLNEP